MRLELAKLVPQHPFDAFGLSDCMSRARSFSFSFLLTKMKSFFRKHLFLGLSRRVFS
jgi:hypothetical protein